MSRRSKKIGGTARPYRALEELYQALFDQAADGIFIADVTGRYVEVNQQGCDMLGYRREEILALKIEDLIPSEDKERNPLQLDELRAEGSLLKERVLRCKDGRLLPVEISARMLTDGSLLGIVRDISQRKAVQEQLRESNERFQLLAESSLTGIYLIQDNLFRYVNPAMAHFFGYEVDEIIDKLGPMDLVLADDQPLVAENIRRRIENEEEAIHYDFRGVHKDGSVIDVEVHGRRIDIGGKVGVIGSLVEITKRKQAEAEHQVHFWFLESLDKVNRAIQGTNDLEQMMINVLDTLLTIFGCDRAFLVYPCDPEAATWQAMMERTRPDYPGVIPVGAKLPMDPFGTEVFRALRATNGPVQFGPESAHQVPAVMTEAFSIQSFIAMALYPKVGQPWSFGLHQCTHPRVWKPEEERLLREIGRRVADSLTSLLSYQNLRESERRSEEAERIAHVGWWDRSYVENRIALSDEACRIFGIPFEERDQSLVDWHKRWQQLIHPEDRANSAEVAKVALQGGPRYEVEYRVVQPSGEVRVIKSEGDVTWNEAGQPQRMFGIMQDITELRQVEAELRRNREAALQFSAHLAALQEVTNQLSLAESTEDLCRLAVQLGLTHLGFDRVGIWFIDEEQGVMRGSFGTDETGELRDERNIEVPFRAEGLAWLVFTRKESAAHVEHLPLRNHLGEEVGQGENAMAALWDSDNVVGVISIDNLFTRQPITEHQLEVLRLYATTLGHLITRKRAEEARRASEARFRTFVDHATDAFFLHDERSVILDVNHQACLSLGYSREELIGMSPRDFDVKLERGSLEEIQERLDTGEVFTFDTLHRRKDGHIFPVEVRVRPLWQGGRRYAVSLARDTTDRKRTQEALTLFRTLIDHTNDAIEVIDPKTGRFLDANVQAYQALGYTREEFLNLTIPDIDPEVDEQARQEMVEETRQFGFLVRESQHRRKDGSVFPVEVNINHVNLDHEYVLAVVRDTTERKRAEEALRTSEERYRALYRDNPSMFFTLDSSGVIISVNIFGASQLGYTVDEVEGMSVFDVIYEADRTAVTHQLQRCVQNPGKINCWQFRKVRKDGSMLWVEEQARAITDANGAINVLLVCQDITDRKQAEEAQKRLLAQIREQAQQVQNIIDTVPEGVILLSKDQFVTLTNPVAREFLAQMAPDWENSRLNQLGSFPLYDILTSPPKGLWHEIASHNLIFEAIARPVENSPHNGGWVLVLRDVTQERDIQQRIQRQDRLAAVGQLAAGIAHDFNNILTVIRLYTQLISRTVDVPRHAQERLNTIEQQTERATDLIQQILDFSRQSVLERQPFDLLPFMRRLTKLLDRTLPENISVELTHVDDSFFIRADPSRIQQMMMNLAVNARDAMPDGGNLLFTLKQVQTAELKTLLVNELPPGRWVVLEVTDNGTGIEPEVVSHMFEPFFTTKQVGVGTGLGLAQVYGIVQQHEGCIDVMTTAGQGTTFLLYFPALETGESLAGTLDKSLLKMGQGQTILLVEDNRATREALIGSLALLNYEVVAASNGREALTLLTAKQADIDLVLSDVVMPEMGGVALFHAIREQEMQIPMVLLTGHSLSNDMENLQLLGLAGWLPKPPDLAVLSRMLAEALAAGLA
ncbi:MAG: PAS domain S-box protein [Anaerolineaceae bacterium]|nr:PAS domain S-box protein [Anaerolineaceae bacterium]